MSFALDPQKGACARCGTIDPTDMDFCQRLACPVRVLTTGAAIDLVTGKVVPSVGGSIEETFTTAEQYSQALSPGYESGAVNTLAAVQVNPWHPINDPVLLKTLGKLGEEINECGAAVMRCIIQGVDEREPVTGKLNRDWLEEEIADAQANFEIAVQKIVEVQARIEETTALLQLDRVKMRARVERKRAAYVAWHEMA